MKDFPEFKHVFRLKTDIQVRINDIDAIGHVNNATWQEYFDIARIHYFNKVLGSIKLNAEQSLVIANVNTDYLSSLYLKDKIWVETKIEKIGTKSIKMLQKIMALRKNEKLIAGISRSILVGINMKTNETIEIPQKWRDSIESFENQH